MKKNNKKVVKSFPIHFVIIMIILAVLTIMWKLVSPNLYSFAHTDAGDINKDGVLNTSDVAQLRTAILSNTDLGGIPKLGDINEDGIVDITDLMLLRRAIVDEVKIGTTDRTNIQIGDYIDYKPDTATAYSKDKLAESISGSANNIADITQDNLKWQILRKYEDGSMDLIGSSTSQIMYFEGADGYNNGVNIMNDICESLYSKSSKGIKARSVNLGDFEYWLTDAGLTERDGYGGFNGYGHTQTQINNRYYPNLYAKEIGAKIDSGLEGLIEGVDKEIGNTTGLKPSEEGNATGYTKANTSLTVTVSLFNTYITSGNFGDGEKVLYNKNTSDYWVASRCVECYYDSQALAIFGLRCVTSLSFGQHLLFSSNNHTGGEYSIYKLRPVVSIPSDMRILVRNTAGEETGTPHTITQY